MWKISYLYSAEAAQGWYYAALLYRSPGRKITTENRMIHLKLSMYGFIEGNAHIFGCSTLLIHVVWLSSCT